MKIMKMEFFNLSDDEFYDINALASLVAITDQQVYGDK